jgi:hypothetical protein
MVIVSEGPAQVILSGRLVGVANPRLTTQVVPGNYELLVRKPGLPEFSQWITLSSVGLTISVPLGGTATQPAPQSIQPAPQSIQQLPPPATFPAMRTASGRFEAEAYQKISTGPRPEAIQAPETGTSLAFIENNTFAYYGGFNFSTALPYIRARVSSATSGGTISVRSGSPNGQELGRLTVPATGGWHNYITVETKLSAANGAQDIYLVFNGPSGHLFNINWFEFGQSPIVAPSTFQNDWTSWVGSDGQLKGYRMLDMSRPEAQIKPDGSALTLAQAYAKDLGSYQGQGFKFGADIALSAGGWFGHQF